MWRFDGTETLDPERVGRDASKIADEVLAHLCGQVGSEATVTLEIEGFLPDGISRPTVRALAERSNRLKCTSHGPDVEQGEATRLPVS